MPFGAFCNVAPSNIASYSGPNIAAPAIMEPVAGQYTDGYTIFAGHTNYNPAVSSFAAAGGLSTQGTQSGSAPASSLVTSLGNDIRAAQRVICSNIEECKQLGYGDNTIGAVDDRPDDVGPGAVAPPAPGDYSDSGGPAFGHAPSDNIFSPRDIVVYGVLAGILLIPVAGEIADAVILEELAAVEAGETEVVAAEAYPSTPVGGRGAGSYTGLGRERLEVQPRTNKPGPVNGVDYTGHAFDRMQERGRYPSMVEQALNNGVEAAAKDGTTSFYDEINNLTVFKSARSGRITTLRFGAPCFLELSGKMAAKRFWKYCALFGIQLDLKNRHSKSRRKNMGDMHLRSNVYF